MSRSARRAILLGLGLLFAVLWVGGVATGGRADAVPWAGPVFLLVAALLVVVPAPPRLALALIAAGGLGFLAELVGTRTGLPFGRYHYTEVLAPQFLGVPLVLACAWTALIGYVLEMTRRAGLLGLRGILAGAAWMVALDLVIDPLAAGPLGYWRWQGGGAYIGVPLLNFAGWFLVSGLILAALRPAARPAPSSGAVGLAILAFFTLLALFHLLLPPFFIGFALIVLHGMLAGLRVRRRSGPG